MSQADQLIMEMQMEEDDSLDQLDDDDSNSDLLDDLIGHKNNRTNAQFIESR